MRIQIETKNKQRNHFRQTEIDSKSVFLEKAVFLLLSSVEKRWVNSFVSDACDNCFALLSLSRTLCFSFVLSTLLLICFLFIFFVFYFSVNFHLCVHLFFPSQSEHRRGVELSDVDLTNWNVKSVLVFTCTCSTHSLFYLTMTSTFVFVLLFLENRSKTKERINSWCEIDVKGLPKCQSSECTLERINRGACSSLFRQDFR